MASMGGGQLDPEPLLRLVKSPIVKVLQAICKAEGLVSSGIKKELQDRIIANIQRYARNNDVAGFNRIKTMLEHPDQIQQARVANAQFSSSPSVPAPQGMPGPLRHGDGFRQYPHLWKGTLSKPPIRSEKQKFANLNKLDQQMKPTPFYTFAEQIGDVRTADTMVSHRHTVGILIKPVEYPILTHIPVDKTLRVMVFGCEYDAPAQGTREIAFPHQSEIKVNGGEIKANLRGLKNRPGSTRPVDITDALRLRPTAYANNVEMTYALTTKAGSNILQKYYFWVSVIKAVPVADLVKKLEEGKRISKDSIINEMVTKARDPDIVATSTVLSLKCPLSYSRIQLPCRSIKCRHNQCFDATSYLQLQEQGPTWLCPICNIPAPYESLAVDEYVRNILANTSRSTEQVTIEPDGRWSQNVKGESSNGNGASFGSDDDDLVEIKDAKMDSRVAALKTANTPAPSIGSTRTPPASSREASASIAPPNGSTSGKRPISQVIDLTLSDDDDDLPVARPPKRQFTGYSTPQSLPFHGPGSSGTYGP